MSSIEGDRLDTLFLDLRSMLARITDEVEERGHEDLVVDLDEARAIVSDIQEIVRPKSVRPR